VSLARRLAGRTLALALGLILLSTAGCALSSGTLGGREKCWPESDQRAPSIWRGILRIDESGGWLDTPEGDVIPLISGTLEPRVGDGGLGELLRGADVMARAGADVTLFGGAGADGALVVCAIEEVHATPFGVAGLTIGVVLPVSLDLEEVR
jgi:hypothetical protein